VLAFAHDAAGGREYVGELLLRPGALVAGSEQDAWYSLSAPPAGHKAAAHGRLRLK